MNYRTRIIKRFALLSLIFHIPPILSFTKIGILFIPMLFWINIPVLWTGIARAMGEEHFKVREFGAMPQSITAYIVIISFWLLLSVILSLLSTKNC